MSEPSASPSTVGNEVGPQCPPLFSPQTPRAPRLTRGGLVSVTDRRIVKTSCTSSEVSDERLKWLLEKRQPLSPADAWLNLILDSSVLVRYAIKGNIRPVSRFSKRARPACSVFSVTGAECGPSFVSSRHQGTTI